MSLNDHVENILDYELNKDTSNKLINQIETEKNLKKYYLLLKCDKAYSGITHFYASNINSTF